MRFRDASTKITNNHHTTLWRIPMEWNGMEWNGMALTSSASSRNETPRRLTILRIPSPSPLSCYVRAFTSSISQVGAEPLH